MTTPRGTCCERCRNNMGGGMTMLPLVRGCANLDCSCHTAPPTEPLIPLDVIERIGTIDDTPTPNTGMEWEERFDERFGLYNELDCKPFIRSLLATQKSQIIAEVEKVYYDGIENLAKHQLGSPLGYDLLWECRMDGFKMAIEAIKVKLKEV